jgi:deazaflavin-dependent oxidoreductase (nitroreductase family)
VSEKQEFEMPAAGMPKWIKDHVELYLSDPERARLWDSTIGGGPGPLPTLLLIARGAKSGKLRPLPLLYQEVDGKYVVIGSKGGAPTHPAWYVNLKGNPECEIRVGSKRMAPALARRAATSDRAAGRRWRRCTRHTRTTRSERVRGRSPWWFSIRSARHERKVRDTAITTELRRTGQWPS